MELIVFLVVGLVAGALARFLVPGSDPIGVLGTILLGVIGSFVGGFLWALITQGELVLTSSGWIGSIVGAVIALLIYRSARARTA